MSVLWHLWTSLNIHKGSKYVLVQGIEDEDSAVSLTNSMFTSIFEKKFNYKICDHTTLYHWKSRMLNILPYENSSVEHLIQEAIKQHVHKKCTVCQYNTEHDEILKWICFPKYLVLTINRFTYCDNKTVKNNISIPVQTQLSMDRNCCSLTVVQSS